MDQSEDGVAGRPLFPRSPVAEDMIQSETEDNSKRLTISTTVTLIVEVKFTLP